MSTGTTAKQSTTRRRPKYDSDFPTIPPPSHALSPTARLMRFIHQAAQEPEPIDIAKHYTRIPGLFRDFELPEIMQAGHVYYLTDVDCTIIGDELLAVYQRKPNATAKSNNQIIAGK